MAHHPKNIKKIEGHHQPSKRQVGDHFSKNHPSSLILKIVENFSNLMKKLNPQEICCAQIYYVYIYIYT